MSPKRVLITIEGNIGGGKSTMIQYIRTKYPEIQIIDEPVEEWMGLKNDGKSLLEHFYEDQTRWSYTFQNAAFITRYLSAFKALNEPIEKDTVYISERGILTDRYVFAQMLRDTGFLNDIEWNLYLKWFHHFEKMIPIQGIVYITTESGECQNRIKIRNRTGEDHIPLDYLQKLDQYHARWLSSTDKPVLFVPSDADRIDEIIKFAKEM